MTTPAAITANATMPMVTFAGLSVKPYSAGISTEGAGSVAYLAHVFGFLAGALVCLVMRAGSRAASNA